jgi:hypothetical protein
MRITFTFTQSTDLKSLTKYDTFKSHLVVPDEALHLIGCRVRVLGIAEQVSLLTLGVLHVTCKELDLKDFLIKGLNEGDEQRGMTGRMTFASHLYFSGTARRSRRRLLTIYWPISPQLPDHMLRGRGHRKRADRHNLAKNLLRLEWHSCETDEQIAFVKRFHFIAEQTLILLNADPDQNWSCDGYHPNWSDSTILDAYKQRAVDQEKAEKKRQKEAKKAKTKLEKEGIPHPKTGAGRGSGAIPGVFKGVQFRSQLEIRFAAELEERGIRWIYEEERLGDGNYLVDFHLPDLKCWVEVKGQFDARDRFLLKDVAHYLQTERSERLYAYTSRRGYAIEGDEFRSMKHSELWDELSTEQDDA